MMLHCPLTLVSLLSIIASLAKGGAQPVFTGTEIFPSEEFAARRAKTMAAIGDAAWLT